MTFDPIRFASRPVRSTVAMKISFGFLALIVSLAAGNVMLSKVEAAPLATPAAHAVNIQQASLEEPVLRDVCRQVVVEVDDGYGVRGHVTRWVCRKVF